MDPPASCPERFVALDIHKHYVVVAAVDSQQHLVLSPRRLDFAQFDTWISRHLQPTDAVVFEATTNAWAFYDLLAPRVATVTVANPVLVRLIAATRVKTDARDSISLARLLAAGLIPPVWVPPTDVRELRSLIAHRQRLIRQRTQARNRLQSVLQRHNRCAPRGEPFAASNRAWWDTLELGPAERLRVRQDFAILDSLAPLIAEVETELRLQSTAEPWATPASFLLQLPGIGVIAAMTLLGAIGDIGRFPTAKQLVGYAGLGASVHASGQVYRTGRITKQGRRELRAVLVEAAWVAVERHAHWKEVFRQLSDRIGRGKAIVAVARKLLTTVWHVLTAQAADTHADVEAVARKFMTWGAQAKRQGRRGLSRAAFVRQQLNRVQLGADLEGFAYYGTKIRLPPADVGAGMPRSAAPLAVIGVP